MPVYEYECHDCSNQFELRCRFDREPKSSCPECGGKASRVFSPVSVIFKGSGFYITDSRKKELKPALADPS